MATSPGKKGLNIRRTAAEDAQWDAVGLNVAYLMDLVAEGDKGPTHATSASLHNLMDDPARLASTTLTLLTIIRRLAEKSPGGYAFLVQNLMDSIPEMA